MSFTQNLKVRLGRAHQARLRRRIAKIEEAPVILPSAATERAKLIEALTKLERSTPNVRT